MDKLIKSDFYMSFRTRQYYLSLISSFLLAAFSVGIIHLLREQYEYIDNELFSLLQQSDEINLFIIRIKDINNVLTMQSGDLLYLCFSGVFLPVMIGIDMVRWILSSYRTGMVRFVSAKGFQRYQIVLSKFIVGAVKCLLLIAVYLLGIFSASALLWKIGNINIGEFVVFLVAECSLHIVFGCICIALTFAIKNEGIVILCLISIIIGFPQIFSLLKVITNGHCDYGKYWILNYAADLSMENSCSMALGILIAVIMLVASVFISVSVFSMEDIK